VTRIGGVLASALVLAGCALGAREPKPRVWPAQPFAAVSSPPAPDYTQTEAWLAWPGRGDNAEVVPKGEPPAAGAAARADAFYIHPTTFYDGDLWNARYDEPGATSEMLTIGVLPYQAGVLNACCRVYAPRYRQATFGAFLHPGKDAYAAFELAYSDVRRAFDRYLAQAPTDRPIVLAGHSQGSLHLTRLLRERVAANAALRARVVVAYVVGAALPATGTPLPACEWAHQTGCVLNWNSVGFWSPTVLAIGFMPTWSEGSYRTIKLSRWLCVSPLTWTREGRADATRNPGSLPPVDVNAEMPALVAGVAGARCQAGGLRVDVIEQWKPVFSGRLAALGSFHNADFNLFYASFRDNARARVEAFVTERARGPAGR